MKLKQFLVPKEQIVPNMVPQVKKELEKEMSKKGQSIFIVDVEWTVDGILIFYRDA